MPKRIQNYLINYVYFIHNLEEQSCFGASVQQEDRMAILLIRVVYNLCTHHHLYFEQKLALLDN